jgi:hypothetical protein
MVTPTACGQNRFGMSRRDVRTGLGIAMSLICFVVLGAEAKTRIALGEFVNKIGGGPCTTDNLKWIGDPDLATKLRAQVILALKKTGRYTFEQKNGKKAKYSIGVTMPVFAVCQSQTGMKAQTGKVSLAVLITNTTTGELVDSFQVDGEGAAGPPSPGQDLAQRIGINLIPSVKRRKVQSTIS